MPPTRTKRRPRVLRMTEDEFDNWHDEFLRGEWVDGELHLMSQVRNIHVQLNLLLSAALKLYCEARQCGEVHGPEYAIRFEALRRRRVPGLLLIATANLSRIQETYFDGAPDAVFEIVSPDSVARDWREKFAEYDTAGMREYWIIDPRAQVVEAHARGKRRGLKKIEPVEGRIASVVISGFFVKPGWFWRDPLPTAFELLRELSVLPPA